MCHSRIHEAGIAHPLNLPYEMTAQSYHLHNSQGVRAFLRQVVNSSLTQESLQHESKWHWLHLYLPTPRGSCPVGETKDLAGSKTLPCRNHEVYLEDTAVPSQTCLAWAHPPCSPQGHSMGVIRDLSLLLGKRLEQKRVA